MEDPSNGLNLVYDEFEEIYGEFLKNLDYEVIKNVCKFSRDVAVHNGIVFNSSSGHFNVHHIPYTLLPCYLPKKLYDDAIDVQPLFNKLFHLVANDSEFLNQELAHIVLEDDFIHRLMTILRRAERSKFRSDIHATVFRSDYMVDESISRANSDRHKEIYLKQVEINTVSCSFAGHASQMPLLHQAVIRKLQSYHTSSDEDCSNGPSVFKKFFGRMKIPDNQNLVKNIVQLIQAASSEYRKKFGYCENSLPRCTVFVVQPNERNSFDQLKLKMELASLDNQYNRISQSHGTYVDIKPGYTVFFATLKELYENGCMSQQDGSFLFRPVENKNWTTFEVEVVYFRAGYDPKDFPSEDEWLAREFIECSRTVKVPTINMQLAGCKKIQQSLSIPSKLSRFLPDPHEQSHVRKFFTGLYSLDPNEISLNEIENLLKRVKTSPHLFVMKPQREGGGFNLYGDEIVKKMEDIAAHRRLLSKTSSVDDDGKTNELLNTKSIQHCHYILMDMIRSPIHKNLFVNQNNLYPELEESVNEIGIWGFHLHVDGRDIINKCDGHLMRTKRVQELDGGVASGRAALGSVFWF